MKNNALIRGSLADIATRSGASLAESFVGVDVVVLLDVSGSMHIPDSRGGRRRYDVALEELAQLQANMPGKIAVIGFSNYPEFAPNGKPAFQGGNTDLAKALQFARMADVVDMRFIVVSDGQPDNEREALDVTATYQGRIDCVFVGPEHDRLGQEFLNKLASAHGGQKVTADRVQQLAAKIERLLLTAN